MGVPRRWDADAVAGGSSSVCAENLDATCSLCGQKWEEDDPSNFELCDHPDLQDENETIVLNHEDETCMHCKQKLPKNKEGKHYYPPKGKWQELHLHCSCGCCIKGKGSHKTHYYDNKGYRGCPIQYKRHPRNKQKRSKTTTPSQTLSQPIPQPPAETVSQTISPPSPPSPAQPPSPQDLDVIEEQNFDFGLSTARVVDKYTEITQLKAEIEELKDFHRNEITDHLMTMAVLERKLEEVSNKYWKTVINLICIILICIILICIILICIILI